MTFTPGPWRVSTIGRRNDGSVAVMSERGPVAYANVLAKIKRGTAWSTDDEESIANAHLIAAAPDLYAAIKAVLARRDERPTDELGHEADDVMALLEAAVAKADGR